MVQKVHDLPPLLAPLDFECITGRGVRCTIGQLGGATACVGNLRFYEEALVGKVMPLVCDELWTWMTDFQNQQHTVVLLHIDTEVIGAVALRDGIRDDAGWVLDYLMKNMGLEVWLCSGDNTATTQCIADELGIRHVVAEALPITKKNCVQQLQQKGHRKGQQRRICFVGDGINDSAALAQADVGVAVGVGAQVAMEAADVTLVRSELSDSIMFLALSKATFRTILTNFFWAFCFNFLCLPLAAGVFYPNIKIPPLAAGIGMAGSSLLVTMSSLLLMRFKSPGMSHCDEETVPFTGKAVGGSGNAAPQIFGSASVY